MANDIRRSISVGSPIQELLGLLGDDAFSTTINGAIANYLLLVRKNLPELQRNEWCAIFDAMNGTAIDDTFLRFGGRSLALEIHDACQHEALDGKWGIDGTALIERLATLNDAAACAIVFAASIFWNHCDLATDEALAKALNF